MVSVREKGGWASGSAGNVGWRGFFLVVALTVAVFALVGGALVARDRALDAAWLATSRVAALGVGVVHGVTGDAARADVLATTLPPATAEGPQLFYLDAIGGVVGGRGGGAAVTAPLQGSIVLEDGAKRTATVAILGGEGPIQGLWYGPAGKAVLSAVPVPGGGWVVAVVPLSGLQSVVLPLLVPPLVLMLALVAAIVALGKTVSSVRSAQDLVGTFRTARAAERDRLRRVTRTLPALLFERMTYPGGGELIHLGVPE
jgi:hypothetical protein